MMISSISSFSSIVQLYSELRYYVHTQVVDESIFQIIVLVIFLSYILVEKYFVHGKRG